MGDTIRFFITDRNAWDYREMDVLSVLKDLRLAFKVNNRVDCVHYLQGLFIIELVGYTVEDVKSKLKALHIPFDSIYFMLVGGTSIHE